MTRPPDRICLTHLIPRPSLGTRLHGGGSSVTAWSWIKIDMQIRNSVVCGVSKGCIYSKLNHPWWVSMLFH